MTEAQLRRRLENSGYSPREVEDYIDEWAEYEINDPEEVSGKGIFVEVSE